VAPQLDVIGVGNAIVDVLSQADEEFLSRLGLVKGAMKLIEAEEAEALYGSMGPGLEMSGGSAANTLAGLASLGGRGAYIGKVHDDTLGGVFTHDIRSLGVEFQTAPTSFGPPTARCLILVTPDAQRTMNTYLGACALLGPEDIDAELIKAAQVTYLEGYLFDRPEAKDAFRRAAAIAHAANRKVSLTLSDSFCVDRHREDFLDLVDNHVDILFANEQEITSLFETTDWDEAVAAVRERCEVAALTRSEKGSVIVGDSQTVPVPAAHVERVVDTTGAGDLYSSGFLYGVTHGADLAECGRLGSVCAAEVISHFGARPETSLRSLAGVEA
jgi:sugar/nucleoside kinase (ribokinase family)